MRSDTRKLRLRSLLCAPTRGAALILIGLAATYASGRALEGTRGSPAEAQGPQTRSGKRSDAAEKERAREALREAVFGLLETAPVEIPETAPGALLQDWVRAHNDGTPATLTAWVEKSYGPKLLARVDLEKHVAWYVEAVEMFGPLRPQPVRIERSSAETIIAHFQRADAPGDGVPDPNDIVVVELDVDPEDVRYLRRGLGLATLACEIREESSASSNRR